MSERKSSRIAIEFNFFSCDAIECTSTKQDDGIDITEMHSSTNIIKEDTIIAMIIDKSWYLDMNDQIEQCINVFQNQTQLPTLSHFAENVGNGLNEKQTAAYVIICSSLILKAIDKYNLLEGKNSGEMQ